MKKPRFNLKNWKEKSTLILLVYRPFGYRLVYSSGYKIPPRYWNENSMRIRATQDFIDHVFINQELDKLESTAISIAQNYRSNNKVLTSIAFKKEMDELYHQKKRNIEVHDFTSFMNKFIEERSLSPKYKKGSIQVYKTAQNHITKYARNRKINFEDLTIDFFLGFIQFLFTKDFSDNHINKIIGTLRTMLNDASDRGFNKNLDFKSKKISVPKKETDHIYLNESDLEILYQLDLDKDPKLDRVRDLFLIAAYTGLRFSDFTVLQPHNVKTIEEVQVFDTTIGKTKDRLIIPIHPIVRTILYKYKNQLPKPISNQKMNSYLKDLCKEAKLTEKVIKREYRGGKMYEKSYKKFQLVGSHTGRRSFATNAYKAGVPMLSIMRITGHKKPETFLKYIKFDNEENALMMAKHIFFS